MKFKWNEIEQDAFEQIKRIVARDTLLTYPDYHEVFKIHINARKFQLEAVIIQNGITVAFYG